jgi:transposase
MRRGMNGLALQVQEGALGRDPCAGGLYVFRGARGDLVKIIWHTGSARRLYSKRLEQGRFLWPSPADCTVAISAAQFAWHVGQDGVAAFTRDRIEYQRQIIADEKSCRAPTAGQAARDSLPCGAHRMLTSHQHSGGCWYQLGIS